MGEELKSCPFCGTEARLLRGGTEAVCASDGETGCNAVYFAVSDWNRRPAEDALRARAEAAEARAAQAQADARLMLAAYFGADGASVARFGLGEGLLSEGDLQRLDALRDATFYVSEADTAAAMLRVLATSGA